MKTIEELRAFVEENGREQNEIRRKMMLLNNECSSLITKQNLVIANVFIEHGLFTDKNKTYVDKYGSRIVISTGNADFTKTSYDDALFYQIECIDRFKNSEIPSYASQKNLKKLIQDGEIREVTKETPVLSNKIIFTKLIHHKDNLYIGTTARGKMVLFETTSTSINIEEGTIYFLNKVRSYVLRKKIPKQQYSRRSTRYLSHVTIHGYFGSYQDIVAHLI